MYSSLLDLPLKVKHFLNTLAYHIISVAYFEGDFPVKNARIIKYVCYKYNIFTDSPGMKLCFSKMVVWFIFNKSIYLRRDFASVML
jgi:hypothetical protein